ncbi:unnamed protein product, partial [Meganyctiphanes norvegica]
RNFFKQKELQYLMSTEFDPLSDLEQKRLPVRMLTVRNPLDRLVSCYMEKFAGGDTTRVHGSFHRSIIRANRLHYQRDEIRSFSFKEFLVLITKGKDKHWAPYYQKCSLCKINYDYILHLDTFGDDLKYIYLRAGIDITDEDQFHTQRNNSTEKIKIVRKPFLEYFENMPKELLRKVYKIYRRDFILFGYEFPDFLLNFDDNLIL